MALMALKKCCNIGEIKTEYQLYQKQHTQTISVFLVREFGEQKLLLQPVQKNNYSHNNCPN